MKTADKKQTFFIKTPFSNQFHLAIYFSIFTITYICTLVFVLLRPRMNHRREKKREQELRISTQKIAH